MNLPKSKVSIVIPIYNMGDKLKTSIKTVTDQTYKELEIILVDDGSSDNTADVCRELCRTDKRIKYVYQENAGAGPARNNGIAHACGKYIYFPDADDIMLPELVEKSVERMEETGSDLAVFGFRRRYTDGETMDVLKADGDVFVGTEVRREYDRFFGFYDKYGIQGAPWNKMFSLDTIKKNGVEYPPLRRHQDEAFITRYVGVAERVVFMKDILYDYLSDTIKYIHMNKYPKDYFEIVRGLNDIRKSCVLSWEPNNKKMASMLCDEFMRNSSVAMQMLFNKKFGYTARERYAALRRMAKLVLKEMPSGGAEPNSTMYRLAKKKLYLVLYIVVYIRFKMTYTIFV